MAQDPHFQQDVADPFFVATAPSPAGDDAQTAFFGQPPAPPKPPDAGLADAIGKGAARGFTARFDDEAMGAIQAALPVPGDASTFGERYAKERDARRAAHDAAIENHPVASYGTEILTAAPAAIATGGSTSGLGRVAAAGGLGTVAGAGASEAPTPGGVAVDAAIGGAAGAGGQAALGEMLFPWLAGKFATRARNLTLGQHGLTRQMVRNVAEKEGQAGLDDKLNEIYEVLRGRVAGYKGPYPERAEQAFADAGEGIRGFHQQADDIIRSAGAHPAAVSPDEVLESGYGQLAKQRSAAGKRLWRSGTQPEMEELLAQLDQGDLGFENLHDWSIDVRGRLYPKKGGVADPNLEEAQLRRFTQQMQEAGRGRALAATPDDAAIPPSQYLADLRDYNALSELDRMSRQQQAHDLVQGLRSKMNASNLGRLGGGSLGAAALLTHNPSLAAGGAALWGLGKAASSPGVNRAAAATMRGLSSPGGSGVGRSTLFPAIARVVGQEQAAADFSAGMTPGPEYTPPSPLKKEER